MNNYASKSTDIKRGQAISFRVPSDTPDYLLKQLEKIKITERRNFSSKIAGFVMQGVSQSFSRERESITIPLPHKLSKSQRDWLKHEHSEALLGSIIYQLLNDPVRATSLLAALNSSSLDIDESLYLQEENSNDFPVEVSNDIHQKIIYEETASAMQLDYPEDDLDLFDWEMAKPDPSNMAEDNADKVETDLDSLLGDFFAKMNK